MEEEEAENNLAKPMEKLFHDIFAKSSTDDIGTDNMTSILIKFDKWKINTKYF